MSGEKEQANPGAGPAGDRREPSSDPVDRTDQLGDGSPAVEPRREPGGDDGASKPVRP